MVQPEGIVIELSRYVFQTLRQDEEFEFSRGRRDDGELPNILLVAPSGEHPVPAILGRLEHEYSLRGELDSDWAARPLSLVRRDGRPVLILEDGGGEPLDRLLGQPMELNRFLRFATSLAGAIGKLHQQGLIHKDIKPANLLVDSASGAVWLTGFGIASRLPRERQSAEPPEMIAGTLAYMAPEQTGRMNRSIDSRSDLYSLGMTFYEMLTGVLPFSAADPMEWVHCHIARQPVPPSERGVPPVISAIVMRLLAKTAEERYQTAIGVEYDLRRCLAECEKGRAGARPYRIEEFPLGTHDLLDRLLVPEKLYGRESEIDALLDSFDRVAANGTPELVLVSGYSGIGKSSVVHELHKVLVPRRGLFASGKFDQYKRDIPYATLAQAFQSLVRPLLGQSEAELGKWRHAFGEALGPNGRLMVDLVPELQLIIGEQPPVPAFPPQEAQRRFQMVFRRFIGVFAQPEHPLALFLDDLQWLDAATLDLIEAVLTESDVQHLLLIGAYRDNEVDATHPLMRKLEAIRGAGAPLRDITLAPLAQEDLGALIADSLHCPPEQVTPLARLVREKTGGNPFFASQFILALAEEELLAFDHDTGRWSWEPARIHAKGYTDNVVDLMVGKLNRLPVETQKTLKEFACLGSSADLNTLSIVHGTSKEKVESDLWEALRLEFVLRLDGSYKFVHDRIQEAAYSLIPEELRAESHLRMGRLLTARTPPERLEETIFEVVNQLNRGATLITSQDEREQLAQLNLSAGKRAKESTAYASALTYLVTGATQLPEDSWERHHALTFELELLRAECEFVTGAMAAADERLKALSTRAVTTMERAAVACLHIDLYLTLGQSSRAIAITLDYLRSLGIDWSPHPTDEEVRREYDRIWIKLGIGSIEDLLELPLMTDPASLATIDVLTKVAPAALTLMEANFHALAICWAANLSLERGNSNGSCDIYVRLGFIAGDRFGDYKAGSRFGRVGCELVERRGLKRFQARTDMLFGHFLIPYTQHVRVARDLLRRGLEVANKIGDLVFVGWCSGLYVIENLLASGDPLNEVQREIERALAFAQKAQLVHVVPIIQTHLQLVRTLRGLTGKFGSFDDEDFGGVRSARNPNSALADWLYSMRKLQAHFHAGDYTSAIEAATRAQRYTASGYLCQVADLRFYSALAHAAVCDTGEQPEAHFAALSAHHRQLEIWAEQCPENFENRAALVGAEIARLEGRDADAMRLYQEAIRSARANSFVQYEALAYELAARFYAVRGFEDIANLYLRKARYGYLRWGADGKVRQLDEIHPHLRTEESAPGPASTIGAPVEQLDLATVIKMSQAVSSEILQRRLIETLLKIALEHAGAERGLLILPHGEQHRIEAEIKTGPEQVEVHLRQHSVTFSELPESLLRYVIRTQEKVILDDASVQNLFSQDEYVRQRHPRSVLCLPLVKQAKLVGVLYLENSLAAGVFTPKRLAMLELLASQAAISLDHARLYAELMQENSDRRKAEEALRASEERWSKLAENSSAGIALLASDGRFIAANLAFQKMLGYTEEELQRRTAMDITHEEDRAATKDRLVTFDQGARRVHRIEKRYLRKDGEVVWADISTVFVPSSANTAAFTSSVIVDITERKRAEEELRRSEAYLAQGQRISQTGSWGWHVATGSLYWSEEHHRIFGYDPQTTTPSYSLFLERIHPEDRFSLEETVNRAVRDKSDFESDYRIVLPDGSVKFLRSVGQARVNRSGELEFIGTVMDITERRRAEEELRQKEASLREAQTELAHVSRLTTMGELAASIAHEVNQPLAGIVTNANASLRWMAGESPSLNEAREAVGRIIRDGNRAGEIIGRLRALAKKAPPQKEWLDLNETIEEVIAMARSEIRRNRVLLQTDLANDLPLIAGDRIQLQQVILNLLINAIEAMGGVRDGLRELGVRSEKVLDIAGGFEQTTLENKALRHAEWTHVLVAVRDSGPGLDPEGIDRLFDAFYTTKSQGMGMGLAISRSIIEAHGGRLWATANLSQGAVFQFTLPFRHLKDVISERASEETD
jgi:PAS domain S-box-containing protein